MEKDLKFVCCQPDDTYYTWQVHLWLESLRKLGQSDKAVILIFIPNGRMRNQKWDQIAALYPESEFVFYFDEHNTTSLIPTYIPILRPYLLWRYFTDHPEMQQKAVFYCDCDIVFTEKFDMSEFQNNDTCYVSDTNSYINARYFDSKVHDVLPAKLEAYKQRDILQEITSQVGISRQVCEANNDHSGGAQYFIKNISADFWHKVLSDCIKIRVYLQGVNREFFESENKGFQSWCADMWAVLWNLWYFDHEVKVIPQMEFAWATDTIQKLDRCTIYHNAGIGDVMQSGYPCFYKGRYHMGTDPFTDPHLQVVFNHETSRKYCTWYYVNKMLELKQTYNLTY